MYNIYTSISTKAFYMKIQIYHSQFDSIVYTYIILYVLYVEITKKIQK